MECAPVDPALSPIERVRGLNDGIDKRDRSPLIIGRVRRRVTEKGAMQNTKLQKYTRGAGNDRTRAVRRFHRVSFTIRTVYG